MHSAILTAALCTACLVISSPMSAADATTPSAAPTPQATAPHIGSAGTTNTTTNNSQTTVIVVDPQHDHDGHHDHDHDHDQPPAPSQSATPIGPTNEATHLWSNPQTPNNPGQKQPWDHSPQPAGPQPLDHIQNP